MLIDSMGTNGQNRRITRPLYAAMKEAYLARPKIEYVARTCGVGLRMARRAVRQGWDDMNLPPLEQAVREELKHQGANGGQGPTTSGDLALQPASADVLMRSATAMGQMLEQCTNQILGRMQNGEGLLDEEISLEMISRLVRANNTCSELLRRSLELQEHEQNKPHESDGVRIGMLLDRCTNEELEHIAETGELPARLIDAHPPGLRELLRAIAEEPTESDEEVAGLDDPDRFDEDMLDSLPDLLPAH